MRKCLCFLYFWDLIKEITEINESNKIARPSGVFFFADSEKKHQYTIKFKTMLLKKFKASFSVMESFVAESHMQYHKNEYQTL